MNPFADRLARARVHIGGVGRIGSGIVQALEAAGVGYISCNDPQRFEEEQLEFCTFSRRADVGRAKVHVLERYLHGRPNFTFEGIVAANQSPRVVPYLRQADVIISCANQLDARLYLERRAIELQKPSIHASAQDGREAFGGLISIWVPGAGCSCLGCLLPDRKPSFPRGEVLLPTVTNTVANLAAHAVVDLLTGNAVERAVSHNLIAIDLNGYRLETLAIARRPGCSVCGSHRLTRAN